MNAVNGEILPNFLILEQVRELCSEVVGRDRTEATS
jgi:hypothetical protein